jgi:cobalt-zinc-cadmium resistance protein CzcA
MINRILDFALHQRLLIVVLALLLAGGGYYAFRTLPIDAYPDVMPTLVQVITEAPGLAPEEVEKLITYPVETGTGGLPGVTDIKSISAFGLSVVNVYFADGTDIYFARQLVMEKLQTVGQDIPAGLGEPTMGPITTALGQIYQYVLEGPGYDLTELRTLQDWIVRLNLRTVQGVTDVLSWGGDVKQYQVRLHPEQLRQYGVTLGEVLDAVEANNQNAGGNFIENNREEYLVRGLGRVESLADLGGIVITTRGGTPVRVRDVATVAFGPEIRRGIVTKDGEGEAVVGIALKLIGANADRVIGAVKRKVADIDHILPEGVKIVPFYDRSELVQEATGTVKDALLEGGVLVVLVLLLFLGDVRSALVVTVLLPMSVLAAFVLMRWAGLSANLMSLGGLAIGIGMLVDGGVVMVENVYRHLTEDPDPDEPRRSIVHRASHEVGHPIVFAVAIIIIVFLPLFTLQGIEGKLFSPMAYTISFAMLGSLVLSLTLIPVLCSLVLRKRPGKHESRFVALLKRLYTPLLGQALRWRWVTIGLALIALAASLALVPHLGTEFIPYLDEGSLMLRITTSPSTALSQAEKITREVEAIIYRFPEVTTVVSFVGRAEASGEPEPVSNTETYIGLKPYDAWETGRTKKELIAAMRDSLASFPGVAFGFSQPIQIRQDELISGVKAQLAIKLYGPDLDTLAAKVNQVAAVVRQIPGGADVHPENFSGKPQLQVRVRRDAISRYGLNVSDVQRIVSAAIGGETEGQVFEDQRRFDIFVRYDEESRRDVQAISNVLLDTPAGGRVKLSELADIRLVTGPLEIRRDQGERRLSVMANVEGRDMGSFVAEAQQRVAQQVQLSAGYHIEWAGQFRNQQRAMRRLAIIVPVTLFLIFIMLFAAFDSLKNAMLIILNVPFALIGGIVSLWITGQYLSVPASVGFIALFGVAVLNGVVLVDYINKLIEAGLPMHEAIVRGSRLRLRPVLMTASVASLGLVPLLFSTGTGSEVQRPLATVVVGGLFTSTLLTLVLLPALYPWFAAGPAGGTDEGADPAETAKGPDPAH